MFISCAIALAVAATAAAAFASAVAQTTVNRIIHTFLFNINSLTHAYLYPSYTYKYTEYHCQHFCFVHSHTCKPAHSLLLCSLYSMFLLRNCFHDYFTSARENNEYPKNDKQIVV